MIDIMTMEQAEAEIYHFRKIFQMIRLFHLNPETQKKEVCKVGISGWSFGRRDPDIGADRIHCRCL